MRDFLAQSHHVANAESVASNCNEMFLHAMNVVTHLNDIGVQFLLPVWNVMKMAILAASVEKGFERTFASPLPRIKPTTQPRTAPIPTG